MSTPSPERVTLLDEHGRATGTALKSEVHHRTTPLHLAFSCYVFDSAGRLLLTQRASSKRTWPGVWTNTCCGHPAPGEHLGDAVRRRTAQELGIDLVDLRPLLPTFRYRATMADGTVENEVCPVFVARIGPDRPVSPDPAEVDAYEWVDWADLREAVADGTREVSPWCVDQVAALPADPAAAPAQADGMPPAATPDRGTT